jgi:hypothetical protein
MTRNRPKVAGDEHASSRLIALGEVICLLAFAHVTCRWFKHYTALGRAESAAHLNFSPGGGRWRSLPWGF